MPACPVTHIKVIPHHWDSVKRMKSAHTSALPAKLQLIGQNSNSSVWCLWVLLCFSKIIISMMVARLHKTNNYDHTNRQWMWYRNDIIISIAPCTAAHQITNKQQNMLMCEEWTEAISIQIDMNLVGMCNADMCHQTCDSIVLTVIVLFYYWMVMIFKIFRTVWNAGCDFILLVSRTCRVPPIRFRIHVEYNVWTHSIDKKISMKMEIVQMNMIDAPEGGVLRCQGQWGVNEWVNEHWSVTLCICAINLFGLSLSFEQSTQLSIQRLWRTQKRFTSSTVGLSPDEYR